jgi:ABC-2 type transport system ATP-binding protein
LLTNPKLVILDEPTVGLDPHIRHQLWEIIRELKKLNIAVILTTHYLDEAEVLSDRICILDQGNIKLIDTAENLKTAYQKSNLESVFLQIMNEESR